MSTEHDLSSEGLCLRCRCVVLGGKDQWVNEPCGQSRAAGWYPVRWRVSGAVAVARWDLVEDPRPWRQSLWSVVGKELGYNDVDLQVVGERIVLLENSDDEATQTPEVSADESWELWDADVNCHHEVVDAPGGGVRCVKCAGWMCL